MTLTATRAVYCYYFPEIRRIIDEVVKDYPHDVFLKSITPGLDDFHFPIIEKYIKYYEKWVPALKEFGNRYFTSGASEGIFHVLVRLRTENPKTIIYVLKGEYEGYKEYASLIGLDVREVGESENFAELTPGVWFLSNPSARNGMIIGNEFVNGLCKRHRVVFDMTYVGLTRNYQFDLSNKSIIAVISSMSKPFGLYYYRIGFTFSREPIKSLEANIWFKNIFSLIIADRILEKIRPGELYAKYRVVQERITERLNKEEDMSLKTCDVLLLAWTLDGNEKIERYKRDRFYRICLTPYFLEAEYGRKN